MESEWKEVKIGALIEDGTILGHKDGNYGSNYPRIDEFGTHGVPLLTAKALDDIGGKIDFNSAPRLKTEKANKLTYGFIETDDVLLSHNATVGRVAVVPTLTERILVGTSLTYYRVDPTRLLPRYLAAFFAGRDFQNQLKAVMSHSTRNQVPITTQRLLTIVLPPLPEQRAIAHILGSLDDKIELNRRMNETLEGMAQALFKSWFVDFDPVIDNAIAAGNPIPEELADRAEVRRAALANGTANREAAKQFPAGFQQTEELGWIPEGWDVKPVGKILNTISETFPLKSVDEVVFLNTGDILDGRFLHNNLSPTSGLPGQAKKTIRKGDILYSEIRPQNRRFAYVYFDSPNHVVSTKLMVLRAIGSISSLFAYLILKQEPLIEHLQMLAESRSGTFPQITFDVLSNVQTALPSDVTLVDLFTKIVLEPTFQKQLANNANSDELTKLRDTLLPKLISGELRIPDAEKLAEAALA
jgi:type I restriction enzyme S subunit